MTIYEIYCDAIANAEYRLSEMETRIEKMYAYGKITEEERLDLLQRAEANIHDALEIDIVGKLADIERRLVHLETADYSVWTSGYTTNKGEVVKYDYNGDGILDLLRYDGGRSYTTLSPGKIDGWHVVDSQGNILGTWYNGVFTEASDDDIV
jgi:hypothetical protein